jgi:hypothetical protein
MQPYAWEFVEESLPVTKMAEDGIMSPHGPIVTIKETTWRGQDNCL